MKKQNFYHMIHTAYVGKNLLFETLKNSQDSGPVPFVAYKDECVFEIAGKNNAFLKSDDMSDTNELDTCNNDTIQVK